MNSHQQLLRERLRWLEDQPADYCNGSLEKASLVTMVTEGHL
ncbi:hypothetical protein [Azotobacter salinestris]|nr:hypothetical protein [Azotobacter salinestris]